MKRDMDLIRTLLLRLEAVEIAADAPAQQAVTSASLRQPGDDPHSLAYHLNLLVDAGFANPTSLRGPQLVGVSGLTWLGHDFLDSVRDPEIWRQTKEGASKAGGFTVDILGDLAKGLIKTQIKRLTGIEL